ncbi:hypothetical protein LI328DRAFT_128676, partial [Trichoderma asperelloides]
MRQTTTCCPGERQPVCAAGNITRTRIESTRRSPSSAQRLISSGVKAAGLPASGVNGRQWSCPLARNQAICIHAETGIENWPGCWPI